MTTPRLIPDQRHDGRDTATARLLWIAHWGLLVLGLVLAAALAFQATVHLSTGHHVNHIAGAWIALARYADHGVLYPPLYDGTYYGGTRYMALPVLAHTATAQLTGEYVMSGKLAGLMATLALATLIGVALIRHARCPVGPSLVLIATVFALPVGYTAIASIRGDEYGVLWQIAALVCIAGGGAQRKWVIAAGGLCVLGVFSKITAIWGPAAIMLWLLWHDRRMAGLFVGLCIAGGLAGLGLLHVLTDGRMAETFINLSLAGVQDRWLLLLSPVRLVWKMLDPANGLIIAPLAAWAVVRSLIDRRISLYGLATLCSLPVMIFVMSDEGANDNHLLDLMVLCAILAGEAWRRLCDTSGRSIAGELVLAGIIAFAGVSTFVRDVYPRVSSTVDYLRGEDRDPVRRLQPVEGVIGRNELVLSDDPYVPVSLGQRPVVMDAWMLLRLEPAHPQWLADLADRVAAQEFDALVVMRSMEDDPQWFTEVVFGPTVFEAMRRHYEFEQRVEQYWIYRPVERVEPTDRSDASKNLPLALTADHSRGR